MQSTLERLVSELHSTKHKAQVTASKRAVIENARAHITSQLAELEEGAHVAAWRIEELERAEAGVGQRNTRAVWHDFKGKRPWAAVAQLAVQVGLLPFEQRSLC